LPRNRRGHDRERAVVALYREIGWLAFRAPGSLGVADVIALKDGSRPRMIEVKSTAAGPYEHFGPADREALREAAEIAGADALLAWWPSRAKLRIIPASEWPG
jgi:Holliday junction resolvase